jgi:uncharacterized repeat protein (TIGR01451 family)
LSLALAAVAIVIGSAAAPTLAAGPTFNLRFSANDAGDVVLAANTIMMCSARPNQCPDAEAGQGGLGNLNNDKYSMAYVNVDNVTPGLFNSSSADLTLPGGLPTTQSVLFAGLYWGGRSASTSRNVVQFRPPGGGYETITGSLTAPVAPGTSRTPESYQMFADVTPLVRGGGAGTYTVANIQADTGLDRDGGWGLVVVIHDPSQPSRNLSVFDGFAPVLKHQTVDVSLNGLNSPPAGVVNTRLGVIAYEGDLGISHDSLQLGSSSSDLTTGCSTQSRDRCISDALTNQENFFNSGITRLGQRVTTKNPDFVNQFGFDAKIIDTQPGLLPNSATSATVRLDTNQDDYYLGVLTIASWPNLSPSSVSLSKKLTDVNGGALVPGDVIQVDITAANSGGDGASNMVVSDAIPPNTTYVPNSLAISSGANAGATTDAPGDDQAEFDAANNRVVFRLGAGATSSSGGTLMSGGGSSVRFQVSVNPGVPGGTVISNSALGSHTGQMLGAQFQETSPVAQLTVAKPDLRVDESHVGDFKVGTTGVYTLSVTNEPAAGPTSGPVTVTDTLPTGLTPTAASGANWNCSVSGQTVSCTFTGPTPILAGTTLPPISLSVLPTQTASQVLNSATVTTPLAGGLTDTASETDPTRVLHANANLSVTKVGSPEPYVAGGTITYTMVATNDGPDPVPGVLVQDTAPTFLVPATVTWTCTNGTGGGTCRVPSGTGSINALVDLPNLATVTLTMSGQIAAGTTGQISNTVSVIPPTGAIDAFPASNTAIDVNTPVQNAALTVTKTHSPSNPVPGQPLTYALVVSNAGPGSASLVRVQDPLIGPLSTFSWTCAPTAGAACPAPSSGTGSIDTQIDLPAGGQVQFTITGTLPGDTVDPVFNGALATPPAGVVQVGAQSVLAPFDTATPSAVANLSVTKSTSPTYVPGQSLGYVITVHNAGPSDATEARVQDEAPFLTGFQWTCTPVAGASCSAGQGSGPIDERVDIPAGSNVTFSLSGTIPSSMAGTLHNSASVTPAATLGNPNPAPTVATADSAPRPVADLSVTTSSSPNPYVAGSDLSYTITVTNAGPSDLTGASVSDPPSAPLAQLGWKCEASEGSACRAASGSGSLSGALVDLAAGGAATFVLSGVVSAAQTGAIMDTVTVQPPTGTTDPVAANNTASDTNPSQRQADLSIVKNSSPDPYQPGQPLTYTITVSNGGPDDAPGTQVFDTLPPALSGFTWSCEASGGSVCRSAGGRGNINPATIDLVAGTSATITLTGVVPAGTTGEIDNVATLVPATSVVDPDTGKNVDVDENPDTLADLSITKVSAPNPYVPGQPLTYTIVVGNAGPDDVGVEVMDSLPAALQRFAWNCTTSTGGAVCDQPSGVGSIDAILGMPAGSTQTIVIAGMAPDASAGTITNTASVELPDEESDPNLSNNSATDVNSPRTNAGTQSSGSGGGGSHPQPTPTPTVSIPVVAGGGGGGGGGSSAVQVEGAVATPMPTVEATPTPTELTPTPVAAVVPPPQPPPTAFAGEVTDSATGLGIAGATVDVDDLDGDVLAETTTDAGGAFVFYGLGVGEVDVVVSAPGYTEGPPPEFAVPDDAGVDVPLYLLAPPVQLPSASTPGGLAGTVSDVSTQAPISGATVELMDADNNILVQATTDDSGRFSLDGLAPGTVALLVSAPGYSDSDLVAVAVPADAPLAVSLSPADPGTQ